MELTFLATRYDLNQSSLFKLIEIASKCFLTTSELPGQRVEGRKDNLAILAYIATEDSIGGFRVTRKAWVIRDLSFDGA